MNSLVWTDTLSAPRSLATRGETGVALIEDPGVLELCLNIADRNSLRRIVKILGIDLPMTPWATATADDLRVVWTGPLRWRVVVPRERAPMLWAILVEKIGVAVVSDLTGAFACFRIVGATANEILARVCPLDLGSIEPDFARGTSIAGVRALLIKEQGSRDSWLLLAPRSFAEHVAGALTEAARTPGRLALFKPAEPPTV